MRMTTVCSWRKRRTEQLHQRQGPLPAMGAALVVGVQRVVAHIVDDFRLVDLNAVRLLDLGAHRAQGGAADAHSLARSFNEKRLRACLRGSGGREQTGAAGADDQNLGIDRLDAVAVRDVGRCAQPVGNILGSGGFLGRLDKDGVAARLVDAVDKGFLHGVGGDARAGHAVDLRPVGGQDLLAQGVAGSRADAGGLTADIQHHVHDACLVKGGRYRDRPVDADGRRGVGAGDIACRTCLRGVGQSDEAGAEGRRRGALQKAPAGE